MKQKKTPKFGHPQKSVEKSLVPGSAPGLFQRSNVSMFSKLWSMGNCIVLIIHDLWLITRQMRIIATRQTMEGPHQHSNVQQLRSNTIKISKTYQQANLKKIEN